MKVIAIAFQRERLIIDEVDEMTASMVASILNDIRARNFLAKAPERKRAPRHYHLALTPESERYNRAPKPIEEMHP